MIKAIALLAVVPALAFAQRPHDFAYGIPLALDGREAFYQVEVPPPVYEGVVRADLGDVRVFNAAGEVVPHAFRQRVTAGATSPAPTKVGLFPLRADAAAGVDTLDLRVDKTDGRTTVRLLTRDGSPAAGTALIGYLADASGIEGAVRAVVVEFPPGADNVAARMRVEASDDLQRWATVVSGASVLRLAAGGERLEQLRIEFPARKAKYLRLTWPGRTAPLELAGVGVEPAETTVEVARHWRDAAGTPVKDSPGEFEFDLGGQFPTNRLRIALPQPNTVAPVEVFARGKPGDPWRPVSRATAYRLNREGEELMSPDLVIPATADRYWRMKIDQRGGGIGGGHPVLRAGWVPDRLVFAARGDAPFQLAYGGRNATPSAYAIATLVPGYKEDASLDAAPSATAGRSRAVALGAARTAAPQALGGAAAMREQIDWKRWVLWGSLALGVAVLGGMALRLGRQMSNPPEPPAR